MNIRYKYIIYKEIISCKQLAHIVLEAEKSPDLAVITLETQETQWCSLSPCLKTVKTDIPAQRKLAERGSAA